MEFNETFANFGNQIAMKKDKRNIIEHLNHGICRFPLLTIFQILNCFVHLGFDLTHVRKVKWFCELN